MIPILNVVLQNNKIKQINRTINVTENGQNKRMNIKKIVSDKSKTQSSLNELKYLLKELKNGGKINLKRICLAKDMFN